MPPNTVKVDRTTIWGNWWQIGKHSDYLGHRINTKQQAVDCYRELAWPDMHHRAWIEERLAGKNLACWCKLDEPCHADVLLELAND